jgi:uncharacterized OsmC-like protein
MVEITVQYEGELHCSSTHGPSKATLSTDAPADNLGRGAAFSPTDLTATSLGACMLTTMGIVAQKKGLAIELTGSSAVIRKHMTPAPPRRIAKIEVEISIPQPASHPDRAEIENAALTCPVALSLHPETEKAVTFHWQG